MSSRSASMIALGTATIGEQFSNESPRSDAASAIDTLRLLPAGEGARAFVPAVVRRRSDPIAQIRQAALLRRTGKAGRPRYLRRPSRAAA